MVRVPTVTIEGNEGQPLIINQADYDSKIHKLISGSAGESEDQPTPRETVIAALEELGIDYNPRSKTATLEKKLAKAQGD